MKTNKIEGIRRSSARKLSPSRLYETDDLRRVTGDTLRPGGFSLTDEAILRCGLCAGDMVLDAGCGRGATVAHMRHQYGIRAVGMDVSYGLLSCGMNAAGALPLVHGKIPHLPFPERTFQAVFCECVLSLTQDRRQALDAFYQSLAPGGFLVLSDIYSKTAVSMTDRHPLKTQTCINGAISLERVQREVIQTGFRLLHMQDHTPLLTQLAANLIFTYGSMDCFWGRFCSPDSLERARQGIKQIRPGYYLLIAQKRTPI